MVRSLQLEYLTQEDDFNSTLTEVFQGVKLRLTISSFMVFKVREARKQKLSRATVQKVFVSVNWFRVQGSRLRAKATAATQSEPGIILFGSMRPFDELLRGLKRRGEQANGT